MKKTNWIVAALVFIMLAAACSHVTKSSAGNTIKQEPPAVLTREAVTNLVRNAGFPEDVVAMAVAIAKCESNLVVKAVSPSGKYRGLFQIAPLHAKRCGGDNFFDPAFNVLCAYMIYKDRGSFAAWGCFKSGRYRKFMG